MALVVTEVFDSLQGEGFWTGVPMTFVRLAGCNGPQLGLGCARWCDTPDSLDESAGRLMEVGDILEHTHLTRLCITGGEPLLQLEDLRPLMQAAARRDVRVHIETNGTLDPRRLLGPECEALVWSTVSPKPPSHFIHPGWEGLVDELKLVMDGSLDAAEVERMSEAHPQAVVSIQPCWGDPDTVAASVAMVMAHPEWRLSLQTHKYLGIP